MPMPLDAYPAERCLRIVLAVFCLLQAIAIQYALTVPAVGIFGRVATGAADDRVVSSLFNTITDDLLGMLGTQERERYSRPHVVEETAVNQAAVDPDTVDQAAVDESVCGGAVDGAVDATTRVVDALNDAFANFKWTAAYECWCELLRVSPVLARATASERISAVQAALDSHDKKIGWDALRLVSTFATVRQAGDFLRRVLLLQPAYAHEIEELLWQHWLRSGDLAADGALVRAAEHMGAHEHEAALTALTQLVETSPQFAEAWNKRATVFWLLDRYDESLADCAVVLRLNPIHFGALSGQGLVHLALWRDGRGASHLEAARRSFESVREQCIVAALALPCVCPTLTYLS